MGSEKRERQRANRAAKQAEEQRQAKRGALFKRGRRILFYLVLFAIVIFLASQIWGGGDDNALGLALGG